MSKLFAVYDLDENDKKQLSTNWLTIGSSFDDANRKKKQTNAEMPSENINKEERSFFNVGQRKTAADLISSDESDTSEVEKKRLKKKRKKQKKAKTYTKVIKFVPI